MDTNKCRVCGHVYKLRAKYEVDTWNVGHYGCTMDNAPRIFKGYEDDGCPKCAEETRRMRRELERQILGSYRTCDSCGKKVDSLLPYCGWCGHKMSAEGPKKAKAKGPLVLDLTKVDALPDTPEKPVICDCGREMVIKNGKYGFFWGCSSYPNCMNSRDIDDPTGEIEENERAYAHHWDQGDNDAHGNHWFSDLCWHQEY